MRVSRICILLIFRLFTLESFALHIFLTAWALKFSKLTTVFVLVGLDCVVDLSLDYGSHDVRTLLLSVFFFFLSGCYSTA